MDIPPICLLMLRYFLFLSFYLPALMLSAQPVKHNSYYEGKATEAPGTYRKTIHDFSGLSNDEKTKAIQMMDAIVDAFKETYPTPVGADIGPYGGIWKTYKGTAEFNNGPHTVHLTIPFFELFKVNNGSIEANGEYSSSIDIWMNSAKYILQANPVQYGNDRVFRKPVPGIAVNGFPKYNNMLLLMPPGKSPPWRPATKQEYLENFMEALRISLPGRSSTAAERQMIPDIQQLLASMLPAEKKQIAYLKKIKYADQKTGYPDYGYKWAGFLNESDTTGELLVISEENFYDKTIPRTSFQLIVIERRYAPASRSASAPTASEIARARRLADQLNNIVRDAALLPALHRLLGKNGWDFVINKKKEKLPEKNIAVTKPVIRNIDRLVDSLLRNYKALLPPIPGGAIPAAEAPSPVDWSIPPRQSKKLLLAARKLNTKEDLVKYLDELDANFSNILAGTTVSSFNEVNKAVKAAYGYWIFKKPREALLLAIKTAKKDPDNNTVLNNAGATLSLCGADFLAIPLYIVCLKKEPGNSTLTNNLGQSYLALGDLQQAQLYLEKAVGASPYHHHANNSLGMLYKAQGKTDLAIQCFENSVRGSFTVEGFNRLKALKKEAGPRLMNYIRHRYKQPDYINFNKYPAPLQCTKHDQTDIRKAQHAAYQKIIDGQITKYEKLRDQQKPLAAKANKDFFLLKRNPIIRPFLPFATTLIVGIRKEYEEKFFRLQKDLLELERKRIRLKLEFDTSFKQVELSFEDRLEALGEGNADPSLDEEICAASNSVIDAYLPQFAEINEERYNKIIHTYKDYLNDYLYWVRFSSFTEEQYRLEYYDVILTMFRLLREVKLTTLHGYCDPDPVSKPKNESLVVDDPDCPLPIGVEIPFVVGKVQFDCKSWGFDIGEGVVLTVEHLMGGATTIAIGPGVTVFETPKIGGEAPMDIYPGITVDLKSQVFVTFDAGTIMDWGLLFEGEIDIKGAGKGLELKQNVTLAVNKGLTAEGPITALIDKYYEIPPETPVNKNVNIYNPK